MAPLTRANSNEDLRAKILRAFPDSGTVLTADDATTLLDLVWHVAPMEVPRFLGRLLFHWSPPFCQAPLDPRVITELVLFLDEGLAGIDVLPGGFNTSRRFSATNVNQRRTILDWLHAATTWQDFAACRFELENAHRWWATQVQLES